MALPTAPPARHEAVAGTFGRLVDGTADWSAPTPVAGWKALDIVGHLVEWFPAFLAAGGVHLVPGPLWGDDPSAAWTHQTDAVQALMVERGSESFTHPYAGTHLLADAIDRFYVADIFMHSWDLARASGQTVELDEDFAAALLTGLRAMEDVLRGSGQYGPAVPVAPESPVVEQLMGFIGRDPAWTPSSGE